MTLKPRSVEPGYARRWLRDCLELVGRSFHTWFAAGIVLSLLCWLVVPTIIGLPLVGFFMVFFSIELAAHSDAGTLGLDALRTSARQAFRGAMTMLWERKVALGVTFASIIAFYYLLALMAPARPQVEPVAFDIGNPLHWLVHHQSPLAPGALVLWVGTVCHNTLLRFAQIGYPLRMAFGLDEEQAELLLRECERKNMGPSFFLQAILMASLLSMLFFAPGLAPLAFCLEGALLYVVFRECFIDGNGNQPAGSAAEKSCRLAIQGSGA
mgnify:CR=1 FL=1